MRKTAAKGGKRKIANKSWCQSCWRIASNKQRGGMVIGAVCAIHSLKAACFFLLIWRKTVCVDTAWLISACRHWTAARRHALFPKKGGWKIERHFLRAHAAVGLLTSPFISPLSVVTGILCENFIYIKTQPLLPPCTRTTSCSSVCPLQLCELISVT